MKSQNNELFQRNILANANFLGKFLDYNRIYLRKNVEIGIMFLGFECFYSEIPHAY
jgi:hypothetical protein